MKRTNLIYLLLVLSFIGIGCAKKGSDPRFTPSTSSTSRTSVTGISAGSGLSIPSGTQTAAQRSANQIGVSLEWVSSNNPVLEETNQGQKYFYVVNIVRINGVDYEFPTIHYYSGTFPIAAETGYFTMNGIDYDLDADCLDSKCSEYAFSVQISKGSQEVQQLMVYIDFEKDASPLVTLNDKNYFMNFTQFYDLIRNYYN